MMIQATQYVILKILANSNTVSFDEVRRLMLQVIPRSTHVSLNSSLRELYGEFILISSKISNLCRNEVEVSHDYIHLKSKECREHLTSLLQLLSEQKKMMPMLVQMYLNAVDEVLPYPILTPKT